MTFFPSVLALFYSVVFYSSQYKLSTENQVKILKIDFQKVEREHSFQVFVQFSIRRFFRRTSWCDERLKTKAVYYESMKRDLKTRPIYECRCDERLKTKAEKSTRLAYTEFLGELEHQQIETFIMNRESES